MIAGDEQWHEFKSEHATWMTEPSGVLNIFRKPNDQWASYAPGEWKAVRDASGQD
ncbi:hypothetical protein [Williamsia phyllosphaerae]|uniref:hypothetical protein n=1 Tax=Williamsia phyllosphaerae TaxID=885042 RepID=UPI001669C34E|nr:hypothetical protein [Williamsia phyllosphaerae]